MPQVTVNSLNGGVVGEVTLAEAVFGAERRTDLIHAAVVAQLAARRLGTHQSKSRGQVSGGGRKPYRQKGTGRARQGSTRSPQWVKGGHTFALTPRDYSQKLTRKLRRKALYASWSEHVAEETLIVIEAFSLPENKTRHAAAALKAVLTAQASQVAAEAGEAPEGHRLKTVRHALVMLDDGEVRPAFRNIAAVEFDLPERQTVIFRCHFVTAPYASIYDLAWADVVIASQGALERVTAEIGAGPEDEQ